MNLGIKKDLVAKAGIPIDPPIAIEKPTLYFKTHKFPIAILEAVEFNDAFETTDKQTNEVTTQPIIKFIFKDTVNPEKKVTSIHFPIDPEDDKFEMKLDGLQKSIKHIFEETIGADKFLEEDFAGTTFAELFENVGKAFNKHITNKIVKKAGEEDVTAAVKSYTLVPVYLKLLWFNNRLAPSMFPNFVQRAFVGKAGATVQTVCELSIGKKDNIVNKADAKPAVSGGARDNSYGGVNAFGMADGAAADMIFPTD